ncbi:MAG: translocation/assembly module TamB domain-containing protein [Candidatus Marinimicrobia bacterium]|nr:translocation/assembly module TamB domain-containing protein [Candidatus Neomarinimicrobiota bacterium]MCF7850630.1 translocation/assembly module TamB domain-containing protein [Candidatus Neomarinimicrobiota bacterium]MCF7903636.1 translocation/assembly module TamB domain-containing protein [Candidatus Neomarinimicrobiota bacterium]
MRRKLVLTLTGVTLLLIFLVLSLRLFFYSSAGKQFIIHRLHQLSAGLVEADLYVGDLELSFQGQISGTGIRFQDRLTGNDLAQVDTLRIELEIGALLKREIRITNLVLTGLSCTVNSDSTGIWVLPEIPDTSTMSEAWTVTLQKLQVSRGMIGFEEHSLDIREQFNLEVMHLNQTDGGYDLLLSTTWSTLVFDSLPPHLKLHAQLDSEKMELLQGELLQEGSTTKVNGHIGYALPEVPWDLNIEMVGNPDPLIPVLSKMIATDLPALGGQINATFALTGSMDEPIVNFRTQFQNVHYAGVDLSEGYGQGLINSQNLQIDSLMITAWGQLASGSGILRFDDSLSHEFTGRLYEREIQPTYQALGLPDQDISGVLSGTFNSLGPLLAPRHIMLSGLFRVNQAAWDNLKVPPLEAGIRLSDGTVSIEVDQDRNRIIYHGQLDSSLLSSGQLVINAPNLMSLSALTPFIGIGGMAQANAQYSTLASGVRWKVSGQIQNLDYQGEMIGDLMLKASGMDQKWRVTESNIDIENLNMHSLTERFMKTPVNGILTLHTNMSGTSGNLTGGFDGFILKPGYENIGLDSISIQGSAKESLINLSNLQIYKGNDVSRLNLAYDFWENSGRGQVFIARTIDSVQQSLGNAQFDFRGAKNKFSLDARVTDVDLHNLNHFIPELPSTSGLLSGSISAVQEDLHFSSAFSLSVSTAEFDGVFMDSIALSGTTYRENIRLDSIAVDMGRSQIRANFRTALKRNALVLDKGRPIRGKMTWRNLDLDPLNKWLPDGSHLSAGSSGYLDITGSLRHPRIHGSLQLDSLNLNMKDDWELSSENLSVGFQGDTVRLLQSDIMLSDQQMGVEAFLVFEGLEKYQLSLDLKTAGKGYASLQQKIGSGIERYELKFVDLDLGAVSSLIPGDMHVAGLLSGDLSLSEPRTLPILKGQLSVREGMLTLPSAGTISDLEMTLNFQDPMYRIQTARGIIENTPFIVDGFFEHRAWQHFTLGQQITIGQNKVLDLRGSIYPDGQDLLLRIQDLDLSEIKTVLPLTEGIVGKASADFTIQGTRAEPQFSGYLQADIKKWASPMLSTPLQNGKLILRGEGQTIHVDSCTVDQGVNGHASLSGYINLKEVNRATYFLDAKANALRFRDGRDFTLSLDRGDLHLRSKDQYELLSGEMRLGETRYRRRFSPQDVVRSSKIAASQASTRQPGARELRFQLRIKDSGNISVNNNLANLKLRTDVVLTGTSQKPILLGRIAVVDGYVLYLDRRFTIKEGIIDFDSPDRLNPKVILHAETELKAFQTRSGKAYRVYLDLTGPIDSAQPILRSDPELDTPDILALLTMGATRADLIAANPSLDAGSISKIVQTRLEDYSSKRISAYSSDKLGTLLRLDKMSIEGNLFDFGKNWGPELVASKKLNENTTVSYRTTVGQSTEQSIQLNYDINELMSVEGQTDQKGRSGLDLKIRWRFR